jgi:hypothetical protein
MSDEKVTLLFGEDPASGSVEFMGCLTGDRQRLVWELASSFGEQLLELVSYRGGVSDLLFWLRGVEFALDPGREGLGCDEGGVN